MNIQNQNSQNGILNICGTSPVVNDFSPAASLSHTSPIPVFKKPVSPPKSKGPEQFQPPPPMTSAQIGLQIAQQAMASVQAPVHKGPIEQGLYHVKHEYHVNEKPGQNQPDLEKKKVDKTAKDRHYRFTDMMTNSLEYSLSVWKKLFAEEDSCVITWLCMGLETCPTTKKLHLQGALYYTNPRSMKQIQKDLMKLGIPLGFLGKNDGTPLSNRKYCLKGDVPHNEYVNQGTKHPNYGKCMTPYGPGHTPESRNVTWWEFGKCPMQGERTDIEEVAEAIQDRKIKSGRELFQNYPVQAYRYEKGMIKHINYLRPPRTSLPNVYILGGEAGSGKTYHAVRKNGAVKISICGDYRAPFILGWDGEDTVCLDEFNSSQCSIEWFLNITDEHAFPTNIKGSDTNFNAMNIYINTNVPIKLWWPHATEYQFNALLRRIVSINNFKVNPLNPTRRPLMQDAMVDYSLKTPEVVFTNTHTLNDEEYKEFLEFRAAKQNARRERDEALGDVIAKEQAAKVHAEKLSSLRQTTGNPGAQLFTSMADTMSVNNQHSKN